MSSFLKSRAVKAAMYFIGTKVAWLVTGPWGWLTNIVLSFAWDWFGDPAVRWAMRKGALGVDIVSGRIKIRKINKAKRNDDDESYWDVISDI